LDLDITCTATAITLTSGVVSPISYLLNGTTTSYVVTAAVTPASCSTEYTITMAISSTSTIAQLVGSSATQSIDVFGTDPAELGTQDFSVVATATATDGVTTLTSAALGFQVDVTLDCSVATINDNLESPHVIDYLIGATALTHSFDPVYSNTVAGLASDTTYCGTYTFELKAEDPVSPGTGTYLLTLPMFIGFTAAGISDQISVLTTDATDVGIHHFDLVVSMTSHPSVTFTVADFL